ncbi:MAG: septum formation initiator family protein [Patescibacteria group bacterium]
MNRSEYKKSKSRFGWGFKIFFIGGVFLLAFICFKISREVYKQEEINEEVLALQKEIDKFEKDNSELRQLAEYFNSDEFKEREAKEKLDLVKEGEKVVVVKKASTEAAEEQEKSSDKAEVSLSRANYYYWWHYFFGL